MENLPQQAAHTQYLNTLMGWGIRGIAFLTTSPEALRKTGTDSVNLLAGFTYNKGAVEGAVDPAKVREVVKQAMDPIKSFFRAGVVITAVLFFGSRVVFFIPFLPTVLISLSIATAAITWDVHSALREMHHAFTHFNRLHLEGQNYSFKETSGSGREEQQIVGISFDQFVNIIDGYSQQASSNTLFLSGTHTMEKSLTSWRPHLLAQIENQSKGEAKVAPQEVAAQFIPVLPLICRVAKAAEGVVHKG